MEKACPKFGETVDPFQPPLIQDLRITASGTPGLSSEDLQKRYSVCVCVFFGNKPSWEVTYPHPSHFLKMISFFFQVGYVIVSWRVMFIYPPLKLTYINIAP